MCIRDSLVRLSAIASAIESAGANKANIINISAKWPVDSRAVREAIATATGGPQPVRLLVTGYTASFAWDESLRETYPSRYRCLPGVIAAVPGDARGEDLQVARAAHADPTDSRLRAPGVDIVVTTFGMTETSGGCVYDGKPLPVSDCLLYTSPSPRD